MKEYILQRLLYMVPTIIGATIIIFLMMHFIPGDPIVARMGTQYDPAVAEAVKRELGLDQPIYIQYIKWLIQLFQGNLGKSIQSKIPVLEEVLTRLPVTLELILFSMIIAILIAVPAGVISSVKPYTKTDYTVTTLALFGISIPEFYLGILLILLFSVSLQWLPFFGFTPFLEDPWANIRSLFMPALTLGTARAALLTRLVRTGMAEILGQDFVVAARARGVMEFLVVNKHALKNALIPTVTIIGIQIGYLLGGAIIVETLFVIPGIGTYGINGILARDYPQVQGFVLVTISVFIITSLIVDVLYGYLDPRIRYERKAE